MLIFGVFLFALLFTGAMRRYALSRQLLDVPNARSSHHVPTPRGGGVAIVLAFLSGAAVLWGQDILSGDDCLALAGAGGAIALIGFLDDHGHIAARWRLLAHGLASAWLLFWLGGLPALNLPVLGLVDLGVAGDVLFGVFLVWLLNLYNFMDGIDGIAGGEAVTVCLAMAVLALPFGGQHLPLLLGAAALGFLLWNFPPAKIFMGDAGSGFLGMMLGGLMLLHAQLDEGLFWAWLIMLGVFVVDSSLTLLRRLVRGERVYEAHRSHAYQFATRYFGRHRPVTLAVVFLNLLWLLPWAWMVSTGRMPGVAALLIAYLPLVGLAVYFRAGAPEFGETRS